MLTERSSRLPTISLTAVRLFATMAALLLASVTFAVPPEAVAAVQSATQGPCGDKPCGPVAGTPTPCGDKACGPVLGNPTPCGDKACGPVAGNATPCAGCGEVTNGNPNQPGAAPSQATPSTQPPAASDQSRTQDQAVTTTVAGGFQQPGQAAPPFNPNKNSGSSAGWVLPVALVGLVALVFVLLVRRQRRHLETPS